MRHPSHNLRPDPLHPTPSGCRGGRRARRGHRALHHRHRLRRLGDDPHQAPGLGLGQRPGLHDLDRVPRVRLVLLVVNVADRPLADDLAVAGVGHLAVDLHPPGLVHLVAGDHAHQHPPLPALSLLLSHFAPPTFFSFFLPPAFLAAALASAASRPFCLLACRAATICRQASCLALAWASASLAAASRSLTSVRSRWMVRMRASSRLALRISLGVSRRSVADWKRRWKMFLTTSLRLSSSCSSLMPRYSAGFIVASPVRRSAAASPAGSGTASCRPPGPTRRGPPPPAGRRSRTKSSPA